MPQTSWRSRDANASPLMRTLKSDGQINPKYPGGIEAIREKLEAESHTVIQKGKRFLVENFEKKTIVPKQG